MGNVIAIQNLNGAAGRRWATISFKGTDELDAALKRAAADLNFRSKSDLLHDVLTRFVAQHNRQHIPMTRLVRAQRTREIAQELRDLWCDPSPPASQVIPDRRKSA